MTYGIKVFLKNPKREYWAEKSTTVLCSIRRSMVIGQTTASKIGDKQADSENCKLVGAEICE